MNYLKNERIIFFIVFSDLPFWFDAFNLSFNLLTTLKVTLKLNNHVGNVSNFFHNRISKLKLERASLDCHFEIKKYLVNV